MVQPRPRRSTPDGSGPRRCPGRRCARACRADRPERPARARRHQGCSSRCNSPPSPVCAGIVHPGGARLCLGLRIAARGEHSRAGAALAGCRLRGAPGACQSAVRPGRQVKIAQHQIHPALGRASAARPLPACSTVRLRFQQVAQASAAVVTVLDQQQTQCSAAVVRRAGAGGRCCPRRVSTGGTCRSAPVMLPSRMAPPHETGESGRSPGRESPRRRGVPGTCLHVSVRTGQRPFRGRQAWLSRIAGTDGPFDRKFPTPRHLR